MSKSTEEKVLAILSETNIGTPHEKVMGFFKFYTQTGNVERSANESGCNPNSAREWLTRGYSEKIIQLFKLQINKVLDNRMTGLIEDTIAAIEERLAYGDYNNRGERIPVQVDKLLKALVVLYDKRALLRGEPTSRVERVSTQERLAQLGKRFAQMPKQTQEFIMNGLEEYEEDKDGRTIQ